MEPVIESCVTLENNNSHIKRQNDLVYAFECLSKPCLYGACFVSVCSKKSNLFVCFFSIVATYGYDFCTLGEGLNNTAHKSNNVSAVC